MTRISKELSENIVIPLIIAFVAMALIREVRRLERDPIKRKWWILYRGLVVLYTFALLLALYTSLCKLRVITGDYKFGIYYCIAITFIVLLFSLGTIFFQSARLARRQQAKLPETKLSFLGYEKIIQGLFLTKYYWAVWATLLLSICLFLLGREM